MALLGSSIANEVGLRLLLCPLNSNIVIRTACCSVGIVLPVYSTVKAIEMKDQQEQQKWLIYWAAYGTFSMVEVFSDKLLSWYTPESIALTWKICACYVGPFLHFTQSLYFGPRVFLFTRLSLEANALPFAKRFPSYHYLKLAFLIWLQLPDVRGARMLYKNHLQPFLTRHQARVDQIMGLTYVEMVKFISSHQAKIQYARSMLLKITAPLGKASRNTVNPAQPEEHAVIDGQTTVLSNAESDLDD